MNNRTLFSDYLKILGVSHTTDYSSTRFASYPPKLALTAIADLLAEYGMNPIETKENESPSLDGMTLPFAAQLKDGHYTIVTGVDGDAVVLYTKDHRVERVAESDFLAQWNGRSVAAVKTADACEPHLGKHRMAEAAAVARKWLLIAGVAFLAGYCFVAHGIWRSWGQIVLTGLYGLGIYISYLLVLKQSGVQNKTADKICGVIESHGCGTVLETSAAKLFGLYPWCEVGLAYFSVSLAALLVCPECVRWLAAICVCCLPYTVWSVSYQKFKAHAWCTMCLTIQALMWAIFIVMLVSGQFATLLPLTWEPAILIACYLCTFFSINYLVRRFYPQVQN
ncbi:MAG: vitamin K epoxide reductase family protein [Bacteroidales bacterium]|nr:vitamin K epoxide reductase family protein [Bacteroidales bacterium]